MGFNWEAGPFEVWDLAGVEASVARLKKEGKPVAANAEKLLASGARAGTRTILHLPPAGLTSICVRASISRFPPRKASGQFRSQRNRMAW